MKNSDKPVILFKYGGNAMVDEALKTEVLRHICALKERNYDVVIVHGGGPFIKQALKEAKIESEFIDGHRKTTPEAFEYVEMALKGKVNGSLVSLISGLGYKAVGLSGKDGRMVIASKRAHLTIIDGEPTEVDLGQVGDVDYVDTTLLNVLLKNDYIPVITCLGADKSGHGFNINGDMFAGHIAGTLGVDQYVVLTDVDGLLREKDDPSSLIAEISLSEIEALREENIIQGGMIPKIESCQIAISLGADLARIVNGTLPGQIYAAIDNNASGTTITK
ncbi:MAG TPA: acetylglutamate kinase [Bacteroidales bacterium]|nr:acetylglutamate kinase [Bacteroidales bacterium]